MSGVSEGLKKGKQAGLGEFFMEGNKNGYQTPLSDKTGEEELAHLDNG